MGRDKTTYFIILLIAIAGLFFPVKADAEVIVGKAPGLPYSEELNKKMSTEVQYYLYEKCEEFGIDYCFALGVIELESQFNETAYNKNTIDRGLMQVNKQWVDDFQNLGWINKPQDLYAPKTNIKCGIYILSYSVMKYGNTEQAYAYYNTGNPNVKSNAASREVMKNWERWKERFGGDYKRD